ncbi:LysR family transcriptional regulator [Parasporobacterium paucivorans]|uniref:DNA-binding transcriptional regulator, LysR family n=1 Tax=Parasporobacterium paucivorans DSM 15970 TaxID=1122934 RepID=A0A1M6HTP5_9FIRM|nr:LysR family transcriptional regulator [Parasporobacterium paucivorans]SHJ25561.1 DNA-binding transcriptional regulator, LysR family [Parasporobacterium paucivorans DSM 15970]
MNISQIKYFLETAKCLNFTKAAQHLFITQPTLGRQITEIESELNMLLFVRSNKGLTLTPAGIVLYEELSVLMNDYEKAVKKASLASQCITGKLNIGILDGLSIKEFIPEMVSIFEKNHPNIEIIIKRKSFRALLEELNKNELDAIISFSFHINEHQELKTIKLKKYEPAFVVPLKNPLSKKEKLEFKDFKYEPLAIVKKEECPGGVEFIVNKFLLEAGFYPNLHFLDSMDDVVLWVESGMRCALLNMEMDLVRSDSLKMYPFEDGRDDNFIELAYLDENKNFALDLLKNYYASKA